MDSNRTWLKSQLPSLPDSGQKWAPPPSIMLQQCHHSVPRTVFVNVLINRQQLTNYIRPCISSHLTWNILMSYFFHSTYAYWINSYRTNYAKYWKWLLTTTSLGPFSRRLPTGRYFIYIIMDDVPQRGNNVETICLSHPAEGRTLQAQPIPESWAGLACTTF